MRYLVVLIAVMLMAGCATGPIVEQPTAPVAQMNKEAVEYPSQEYLIQIGDELDIKFLYNPELNEKLPVRPDGRISLQLVKEVAVVGLTPAGLEKVLTEKYAGELKKPEIAVIVRTFTAYKVFVDGEVYKPGPIALVGPMTVYQAVVTAGGWKETARMNEIVLIRGATTGKPGVTVVNLEKVLDNSDMTQNIQVMPMDIVYVPKSPIANLDTWVDLYIRRLIPWPLPAPYPTAVNW